MLLSSRAVRLAWTAEKVQFHTMDQTSWADVYGWRPPAPGEPVIRQLYDQVRRAIHEGALPPGGRLPSSRGMAQHLGVARASVVAAYDLLRAEGYIEGR